MSKATTATGTGLQFNPEQGLVNKLSHISEAAEDASTPEGEAQEIVACGTTGKAILLTDEMDPELNDKRDYSLTPTHSKNGVCANCPNWLGDSSLRTKRLAALAAMMLLCFVAVMIVGIATPSSSSTENAGGDGVGNISQNTAMDRSISAAPIPAPTTPSPEPVRPDTTTTTSPIRPLTATAATSPPTKDSVIVPISNSKLIIQLPSLLERKVPNFSDGLNVAEEQNWILIKATIQKTIYSSLAAELDRSPLAADYSLDSIEIDKFDGFVTSFIRTRKLKEGGGNRYLQQTGSEPTHIVLYSASVTVNCLGSSKCFSAPKTVAKAASALSNLDFLVAALEEETDPPSQVVITRQPTKKPVAAIISTPAPISISPTVEPTPSPVPPVVTVLQTSETPTMIPPPPPLEDGRGSCNIYTPCEMCRGLCYTDDQCEDDLLCFLRRGYEFIPGCEGPGNPGVSYCYDPFATGLTEAELLNPVDEDCDKKARCGKCRGNCSGDKDCENGLYCYRRFSLELVPGCAGQGLYGMSYCFDPADLEDPGGEPF